MYHLIDIQSHLPVLHNNNWSTNL